jgi:tRNA (cmo5U34)-methyltransferase
MSNPSVAQHFNEEAETYTDHIVNFIPQYHEQNAFMMDWLPWGREASIRILDLGAGPGVLSGLLLEKYPQAHLHVLDLAGNMIAAARKNFAAEATRITYQQGDFSTDEFGTGYDLIVSGLSIHHLPHEAKRSLFQRLFAAINPGGMLLIRDIVQGESDVLTALYEEKWCAYIRSRNADEQAVMHRYHAEDQPAPLEAQLAWLREAGFAHVGSHWKLLNFAIFSGTKPG